MTQNMELVRLSVELSDLMLSSSDLPGPAVKLITRGGGSSMMPFFVACRNANDLFICIRKSSEPSDFLLVLDYEREYFQGGYVHRGVLRAARWIIEQSRRYIDECDGRIICCGHSLGGASAGMVATVLTLEEHRQNVIGICTAPFPILTENLVQLLEPTVISFVYCGDIVPRLSSVNTGRIVRMFTSMTANPQQAADMIQHIVAQLIQGVMTPTAFGQFDSQTAASLQAQLPSAMQRLMRNAQMPEADEFVLPGRAYLLELDHDGNPWARLYMAADAGFNVMAFPTFIVDHSLNCYHNALFLLDSVE
jgi:hypothetical protein